METPVLNQTAFLDALKTLLTEAYLGPPDPRGTWFVDNEPDCGFAGLLDRVTAAQASLVHGYPTGGSIAAHAYHIEFALDLVLRAARGDNAHETAQWSTSWDKTSVNEAEWTELRAQLRTQVAELLDGLTPGPQWTDPLLLTASMGVVAHGAWHLGALRQLLQSLGR